MDRHGLAGQPSCRHASTPPFRGMAAMRMKRGAETMAQDEDRSAKAGHAPRSRAPGSRTWRLLHAEVPLEERKRSRPGILGGHEVGLLLLGIVRRRVVL